MLFLLKLVKYVLLGLVILVYVDFAMYVFTAGHLYILPEIKDLLSVYNISDSGEVGLFLIVFVFQKVLLPFIILSAIVPWLGSKICQLSKEQETKYQNK